VIRTEELLSARRIDGARQYFTRMRDFGYSKRADETLAMWGHEEALADVVWVIRTFQPDVIVTRFTELPPNHGHHTASAILAREAFTAAADATRFPEQLQRGATVWKVERIVNNVPMWGKAAPPADAVSLDVGVYDPRFGLSMGELAARSRSQHKSQGFGVPETRGQILEYFSPVAGSAAKRELLEGIDATWNRYGGAAYMRAIADAQRTLERDHPERALPALVRAAAELDKLRDDPRVRDARRALAEIIAGAAGLYVRANAATPAAAPGSAVEVEVELVTRGTAATFARIELPGAPPVTGTALAASEKKAIKLTHTVAPSVAPTQPYWLAVTPQQGRYEIAQPELLGAPRAPAALEIALDVAIAGRTIRLARPVVHVWTDRVIGERERSFSFAPAATVTPLREAVLYPGKPAPLDLRVRAGRDAVDGVVTVALPPGWTATPAQHKVALAKVGDEAIVRFELRAAPKAGAGEARALVSVGGGPALSLREDVIDHAHIPLQSVLHAAVVRVAPVDLKLPAGRVGYIMGSGDSIAADLAHVGLAVDELDDDALRTADLSRYTAVVVGIRAYNTRSAVASNHARLLAYAERGGTLIVQYNTVDLLGPLGPKGFEIGRDRITDETAPPTFLERAEPLLTRPNAISAADFNGWIQERGIYFAKAWDPTAKPLLRFADPGEGPLDGALVVQKLGKGRYIYTGLALFRQLPAGVPGAYRLLANLIGGGG
jgi:hypothetical protein